MIRNNIKNERGIALATLLVTVLLLMIITTTLATNSYDSLQLSKLNKLGVDIQALDDRVASYYVQKDELPVDTNKTYTKSELKSKNIKDLSRDDGDRYYLLDLTKLDNLSLNYKNDQYIINEQSHTIYNYKGINYKGTMYHTVGNDSTQNRGGVIVRALLSLQLLSLQLLSHQLLDLQILNLQVLNHRFLSLQFLKQNHQTQEF